VRGHFRPGDGHTRYSAYENSSSHYKYCSVYTQGADNSLIGRN
jgi:hypothetical protein